MYQHEREMLSRRLIAFSSSAIAQDKLTQITPDALVWKDNPAFPRGVQIATLVGDPTRLGTIIHTLRARED